MDITTKKAAAMLLAAEPAAGAPLAMAQPADSYPSRPVMVVAGIAAGGPIDLEARLYTPRISALLGQSFVLDFKPGASGTIGAAHVARARPDGHTLMVVLAGFTVFPSFYKDLSFDVVKDFAPVSLMSERTSVLQVPVYFPVRSFPEYIAHARAHPGKINYGTTGAGSITHLAGAWMHWATQTRVTFIPYKGTGPLLLELVAWRVDVASGTLVAALPIIKAGKVRPIAILNDKRSRLMPEVPTVAEQGGVRLQLFQLDRLPRAGGHPGCHSQQAERGVCQSRPRSRSDGGARSRRQHGGGQHARAVPSAHLRRDGALAEDRRGERHQAAGVAGRCCCFLEAASITTKITK